MQAFTLRKRKTRRARAHCQRICLRALWEQWTVFTRSRAVLRHQLQCAQELWASNTTAKCVAAWAEHTNVMASNRAKVHLHLLGLSLLQCSHEMLWYMEGTQLQSLCTLDQPRAFAIACCCLK